MIRGYEKKGFMRRLVFMATLCMMLCMMFATTAFAANSTVSTEQAQKNLTTYVQGKMASNTYELEGGGYIAGSTLFTGSATNGYDLDESQFQLLTSASQSGCVSDIASYSNEATEANKAGTGTNAAGVSDQTVQNWWRQLQQKDGVGSKFLNTILENTKPDFVTANVIWEPFSGPVGVVMGILAVAMMSFLGVVMVADIAYITLPPIRLFVSDYDSGNGKIAKSKIFSHDALYAVKKAESASEVGSPKQALGIYFKRRVFMLILLGICLLYLIQGQLYTLVGYILDLVSGFLGF